MTSPTMMKQPHLSHCRSRSTHQRYMSPSETGRDAPCHWADTPPKKKAAPFQVVHWAGPLGMHVIS